MHYFYFDTSALAKRYSPEAGSEKVDSIINDKINAIVIGNIAITEIYSALSKKYRIGEISNRDFLSAIYRWCKWGHIPFIPLFPLNHAIYKLRLKMCGAAVISS